jgi:hypothetical protein
MIYADTCLSPEGWFRGKMLGYVSLNGGFNYATPSLLVYKARTYNKIQTLQSLTTKLLIIFLI